MSFSNTYENNIMTWVMTNSAVTRPTAWYVGLFTSNPAEDQSGTEVSGNGYSRVSATFTVTGDTASNSADVEFSAATASWGTITHIAVHDASTGGNIIAYGALTASKDIGAGDIFRVSAGDLDITLD